MANEPHYSENGHGASSDKDDRSLVALMKSRVPKENATIEEIAEAAAKTSWAAESFLSSEPRTNGHSKSNARS